MNLEPTRIAQARLRAGLSKSDVARRLGSTPRTITNYESKGAPDRVAPDLSLALGCPPSYLVRPPVEPLEEDLVFFRARRRSSAAEKHAAIAAGTTGVELYEVITEHFDLPQMSLPDYSGMDPQSAAQQLRAEWQLGWGPLPNSIQLAESHGVRVLSLPAGTQDVDAFSLWNGGHPYVFLSTLKTAERSRFDLAHEIGHLVMHGGFDSTDNIRTMAEKEADVFASEFLMPRAYLKSSVGREPSIASILRLKAHLGVSAMAMAYSSHKAGLLSDWGYRQTCIELTKLGYRTGEPEGMKRETSRVFTVALPALRKSKGWDTADIADRLGVNAAEVHGLSFGQALTAVSQHRPAPTTESRGNAKLSLVR